MVCSTRMQQVRRLQRSCAGRVPGGNSHLLCRRRAKTKRIARSDLSPIFALPHSHHFIRPSHRNDRIDTRARNCSTRKANRPACAGRPIQFRVMPQDQGRHQGQIRIRDRFGSSASDNLHLRPRPFVLPSDSRAPAEHRQAAAGHSRPEAAGRKRSEAAAGHKRPETAGRKRSEAAAGHKRPEAAAGHKRPEVAGHKRPEVAGRKRPEAAADHKRPEAADSIRAGSNQAAGCWR
jgi:hypothetical protein